MPNPPGEEDDCLLEDPPPILIERCQEQPLTMARHGSRAEERRPIVRAHLENTPASGDRLAVLAGVRQRRGDAECTAPPEVRVPGLLTEGDHGARRHKGVVEAPKV